jgi:hypothetical protein
MDTVPVGEAVTAAEAVLPGRVQALGNLAASAGAGALRTWVSPRAAFAYLAAWMAVAAVAFFLGRFRHVPRTRNRTGAEDNFQAELVTELGHGVEARRVPCPWIPPTRRFPAIGTARFELATPCSQRTFRGRRRS